MIRKMIGRAVVAAFGTAMALCGPSAPANAQSGENCYDVILYCKYHNGSYASFQDCLDKNRDFFCPPERTGSAPDNLVTALNALKNHEFG